MGQIAIVSLQNSNSKVIECFNVESRVLCMVHVPAEGDGQEPSAPAGPEAAARRTPGVPTVCLGTEEGRWVLVTVTAASRAQQQGLGRAAASGSHVTCVSRSWGQRMRGQLLPPHPCVRGCPPASAGSGAQPALSSGAGPGCGARGLPDLQP